MCVKTVWLKEEIGCKAYLANSEISATVLLKRACILPQAFIFALLHYKTYSRDIVAMLVLSTSEYCLTSSPFSDQGQNSLWPYLRLKLFTGIYLQICLPLYVL